MSGIVGIVNLDGAPVDRQLLERMTEFLAFRGPDFRNLWIDGTAGFGHTLLKTTDESEKERQPLSLDGKVWIVADARVDARHDLIGDLRSHGHEVAADVPDVELILRAYCVWHEECVEHLLGDFAFGIWDAPRRRLFCARDHMGVKPFFYARLGQCVVFSNTLDCIRQHPLVSDRLNDLAVADFLLFNLNQDVSTTTFADIQRVPPAHCAVSSENGLKLRRYWTLPIDEPIYYRRHEDYVERFGELLRNAVRDRLRTDRVVVSMSGGMDSTTLAATAHYLMRDQTGRSGVCAFTTAYEGYDQEAHYAGLVAERLGIRIQFEGWNPGRVDSNWYRTPFHTPEPVPYPASLASDLSDYRLMASHGRVAFYGEGPDNALLYEWYPYLRYLVHRRRFGRLLYDLSCHAVMHRRVPLLPSLRRLIRQRQAREPNGPPFPDWFNADLEERLQLRARWEQLLLNPHSAHPIRPRGYASFDPPLWQALFESLDAASTRFPLEFRHPYVDVRLLRFLLAVPALPWCRVKYLLRRTMRSVLPEPVLRRPKTPVGAQDPWTERVIELGLPALDPSSGLGKYVNIERLQRASALGQAAFWVDFRTRSLNYWIRNDTFWRNNQRERCE